MPAFRLRLSTGETLSLSTSGPVGTPPAAPSSLVATAAGASAIDLTWTNPATDETSVVVERSADGSTGWATRATLAANATSYTDSGLAAGTEYFYRAKNANAVGSSAYSNTHSATTGAAGGALASLALTNTSASPTAATTFLPLGHPFAEGDVPAGSRLAATWNGASVPAQVSGRNSWPDGSLRFARVAVKLPAVAGSASGTLALASESGTQSSTIPGGRTAAQVVASLASDYPFTVTAANLLKGHASVSQVADGSGSWTWTAATQLALFGATDGSGRVRCELVESGPLCVTVMCWGPFLDDTGAAPHKHLIVRAWYRCWLDATTGAIDRVEHLHAVENGWIEALDGTTTPADLEIGDFAVKLSGSAVTGLSFTGVRVVHHTSNPLCRDSDMLTAGSAWTAGTPTLRAAFDLPYWHASCLMPPFYDAAYFAANPIVPATDTSPFAYAPGAGLAGRMGVQTPGVDSATGMEFNRGGQPDHIGMVPAWSVRAYLTQEAGYVHSDVATALKAGTMPHRIMNPSTGRIPVVMPAAGLANTSNALMGSTRHGLRYYLPSNVSDSGKPEYPIKAVVPSGFGSGGVTVTTNTEGGWAGSGGGYGTSHWPSLAYHAYLRTGAPWLMETVKLHGNAPMVSQQGNAMALWDGTTAYGRFVATEMSASMEHRHESWAWKVLVQCLAVLPDDAVERPYFAKAYADNCRIAERLIDDPARVNFRALGIWGFPIANGQGGQPWKGAPWQQKYTYLVRSWEYLALGRPAATLAYLTHHTKAMRAWAGHSDDGGFACPYVMTTYYTTFGAGTFAAGDYFASWAAMPYLTDVDGNTPRFVTFTSGDPWIAGPTMIHPGTPHLYVDGDRIMFPGSATLAPPSPFVAGTFYYIRDMDQTLKRYKLAATAGGTPITPAATVTTEAFALRFATCPTPNPALPETVAIRADDVASADAGISQMHSVARAAVLTGLAAATDPWVETVEAYVALVEPGWETIHVSYDYFPRNRYATSLGTP